MKDNKGRIFLMYISRNNQINDQSETGWPHN